MANNFYRQWGKRMLDLVLSLFLLWLLSPALLVSYLLCLYHFGSPAIFRQKRIGKDGEVFSIHKLKTMTDDRDADGRLLPDAQRLTPFGQRLRSTSLDELPQLFDVLRGKMSLVGPRPLPVGYRERYSDAQWKRHAVMPGITGWTAVNGRNLNTWPKKFELDLEYVEAQSLAFDLKVLYLTVLTVLGRTGVSHRGDATMPEFLGNEESTDF